MAYQKKTPEEVRASRMRAVAAMQAARARKHEKAVAAGTAGRRTLKERGRMSIEVYAEDARKISAWAERDGTTRREIVRGMVQEAEKKRR